MNRRVANPNSVGLSSYTAVADIDIVIAGRQINASARTQCDIAVAGGVVEERERAIARVVRASGSAQKRAGAGGCVLISSVYEQGACSDTRVELAVGQA